MEYLRARREARHALVISDPQPVANIDTLWMSAGQAAVIGIFLLLFGGFLYIGRAILLPILASAIISLTLAPLIKAAKVRHPALDRRSGDRSAPSWRCRCRLSRSSSSITCFPTKT